MGTKAFASNWESVTYVGATVDALASVRRVVDNVSP